MVWRPTTAAPPSPLAPKDWDGMWQDVLASRATSDGPHALTQYADNPVAFFVDVLGLKRETIVWSEGVGYATHQWDGTRDPLALACACIARGEWIALSSGTGTGKTLTWAALILWHLAVYRDSITVTVATTEDQMLKGVWREVGRLFPAFQSRFPSAELTTGRIRMDGKSDAWAAWTITAKVAAGSTSSTSVQGLHAEHLLILVDEMPGVPAPIVTALINTASDIDETVDLELQPDAPIRAGNIIAGAGNPDHQTDQLAVFGRMKRVTPIRVSGLDHPNVVGGRRVVPGAVTRGSVQMRADEYGVGSPMYDSRVRGIPPDQAEHALIKRQWVLAAFRRAEAYRERARLSVWPIAYGVDPSNSDKGDLAAVARWEGPLCTVKASPCPNANKLGTAVWRQAESEGVSPEHIGVDSIGVGAGTTNEINRIAPTFCRALNSGESAQLRIEKMADGEGYFSDANLFLNLRAQMYWQLRLDLEAGRVALEEDDELLEELIAATYEDRVGKIVIEAKKDIRIRLRRSPNKADAVVYGNWVRPRSLPPSAAPLPRDRDMGLIKKNGKLVPAQPSDIFKREHAQIAPGRGEKFWNW